MKKTLEAMLGSVDQRLIDVLLDLLHAGPQDVEWLTARARRRLQDARVDDQAVWEAVQTCTLLIGRPDGSVIRLIDALDGQMLTHRVAARTEGRAELWSVLALIPLIACAGVQPIPLVDGGEVAPAAFGHSALVGPPGWLPPANPGQLLGFRISQGRLSVHSVASTAVESERDVQVRQALTTHYRTETWFADDELQARPGALNRAIGFALLEHPDLFTEPVSPLNELLYDALREGDRLSQFRDRSAWEAGDCVDLGISGMPEYLCAELSRRASAYGMSLDQFVVLALGHMAWRTPFAEDLGPWEAWAAEEEPPPPPPVHLRVT